MMNSDEFSDAPEETEPSPLDIEDGLSFASSMVTGDNTRQTTNAATEVSLLGDQISTSTPTKNNYTKQVGFVQTRSDGEEEDDIFETNIPGAGLGIGAMRPFSDSEDSNTKLDRAMAKIEDEVDAEEEFAAAVAASSDGKYDLGGPVVDSDGTYDLGGSKGYDLGKPAPVGAPSSVSKDDDETSLTQHRSGASIFCLHSWVKRKDWESARSFLTKPGKSDEEMLKIIFYANEDGETSLHIAARRKCPLDIIMMITERAGRKIVLAINNYGRSNPLHHACHFNAPPEVVHHLIDVGGAAAVRAEDDIGNTPLQWALSKRLCFKNIKHLIEIGGMETACCPNRIGWTALHTACYFDANTETIKYLVECTGSDSVRTLDKKSRTPLDLALERNSYCVSSIIFLLQQLSDIDEIALYLPQKTINSILEWARLQSNSLALETPIVQRILNETFISRKYLTVWMVDFYLQVFIVAMFSFGIDASLRRYDESIGTSSAIFLYIAVSWFLGREAIQLITTPFNEFIADMKNWLDFTQVIMLFMSLDVLVLKGGVQTNADAGTIIFTAGLVWFNLLSVLGRAFYRLRVFIIYIQMLIWNLMPLFFGSTCIIAAFAQMYYIANNYFIGTCTSPMIYTEDQDWTCTLGDTYFMTFSSIVTGHWRFMEQPSGSPMTVLSFALAVITILVLFTSLIGQVFALNDEIQERGRLSFWANRLYTIVEISDFNETLGCGCCRPELADDDKPRWKEENKDSITPKARFSFEQADKYRQFPDDDNLMRDWFVGEDDRVPTLRTRALYFLKWAPVQEILVPGRLAERMIAGHPKDAESYLMRLLSYVFYPILLSIHLLIFAVGAFTLGLTWPRDMKRRLFCGTEYYSKTHVAMKAKSEFDNLKNTIEAVRSEVKGDRVMKETLEANIVNLQKTLNEMSKQLKLLSDDGTTNGSFYDEDEA